MSLFEDSFFGTQGTALNAHVPTSIGSNTPNMSLSWAIVSGKSAPLIDGANRGYTSSTGVDDYVSAAGFSLVTDDYDAEQKQFFLSGNVGTDNTGVTLLVADDQAGNNYAIKLGVVSNLQCIGAFKNIASNSAGIQTGLVGIFPDDGGTLTPGDAFVPKISVRVNLSNSAHRDVDYKLQRVADSKWMDSGGAWQTGEQAFHSITDTSSVNTGGHISLRFYDIQGLTTFLHVDNFLVTAVSSALAGGVVWGAFTDSAIVFYYDGTHSSTAPSGGVAPLTNQWYQSTTPGFTPGGGNIVSGETGDTYTPSGPTTTPIFVKVVTTDSAAATVTSQEAVGRLLDGNLNVLTIYDSLGTTPNGNNEIDQLNAEWATTPIQIGNNLYSATIADGSKSGSGTENWVPDTDPAYVPYGVDDPLIDWALGLINPDVILFRLGTNDSGVSATEFDRRIGVIFAYILAAFPSAKIIVHYLPYGRSGGSYGDTYNARVYTYQPKIDGQVNNVSIFTGDKMEWVLPGMVYTWRISGTEDVHPGAPGAKYQKQGDIATIQAAINIAPTGNEEITFAFLTTGGSNYTGAANTITATRVINGGGSNPCDGSVTKLGDGSFKLTPASTDLAGNEIVFTFAATGCRDTNVTVNI